MKELLQNKNISLACFMFNSVFAFYSFTNGDQFLGWLCIVFSIVCIRNWLSHP